MLALWVCLSNRPLNSFVYFRLTTSIANTNLLPHYIDFLAWGMTETSPVVTVSRKENGKIGSCGVLVANTKGKIADIATGKSLGPHQRGELCVKGPQVILNYGNHSENIIYNISSNFMDRDSIEI